MILLYHHVTPSAQVPPDADPDHGWEWTHATDALERHVARMRRKGIRIASLDEVVHTIRTTGREPARTVVLTFDDGWIDNYLHAAPLLERLGATATFFVTTEHLRRGEDDPARMSVEQLRDLHARGFTIAAHGRTHRALPKLDDAALESELAGARQDLERALDAPVDLLAYPGGAFDARVVEAVRKAGYRAACSSLGPRENRADSLFWMYRNVLSEHLRTARDRYRLSPLATRVLARRVERRTAAKLQPPPL